MLDNQQPANPLQLGQTLYEVLDATLIATPRGDSAARYHRVVCNADGIGPAHRETTSIDAQERILDVKVATDMHAARQQVFVLTADGVQMIGSDDGRVTTVSWTAPGLSRIVDLDPQRTGEPGLLLIGQDKQGTFLQSLNCASGALDPALRLPAAVAGALAGALLVRNQTEAHVIACMVRDGGLTVHDLGTSVLGANPSMTGVTSVELGGIQDSAVVGAATASLVSGTADQQVVLAYPDASGAPRVAVLGWNGDKLARLATLAPDVTFAPPAAARYRVATADLTQDGVDQVVIGYPATYAGVAGCAALLLLKFDNAAKDTPLRLLSKYAVANTDNQPLASIDLHLAAGLFGEALPDDQHSPREGGHAGILGVLIIGGGATFGQVLKGEASVLAGLVTVDPVDKAFPPLGSAPGVPQLLTAVETIDYQSPGFFALPSDLTGQSVILGPPTLSQAIGKGQLLAIIQAPPYERAVTTTRPSLTFGQGETEISGYNVNSNKTWMFSNDTAMSLGISTQTLSRNVNNSYGHGFDKLTDNSTTTTVQTLSTISLNDLVVLYQTSYYVWTYPVYRKASRSAPDGTMAVIFPVTPQPEQTVLTAGDPSLGYAPRTQNGTLLTDRELEPDEFDPSRALFGLYSIAVTDDTTGSTLPYDQTKMNSQNLSKNFTVHNTAADSAHFSVGTTLLQYVPVNFGLNLTNSDSYSESNVETTSLSHTVTLSITINTGSVKDIGYEYLITPYIYQHATLGCLVVSYRVSLQGKSWGDYYRGLYPQPILQALYPNSVDPVLAAFSRSISFRENSDGTVTVSAELFNNGLTDIEDVVCEFYRGAPESSGGDLTPPKALTGQRTVPNLRGSGRATVSMPMTLTSGDRVTVLVYVRIGSVDVSKTIYWAVYPASAFAGLPETRDALALDAARIIP